MDWGSYLDQVVVGLIGLMLTIVSGYVAAFIRQKIGSEVMAAAAQDFLAKRATAEAIWHQVEGSVEGKIKAGSLPVMSALAKMEIKLEEYTREAIRVLGVDKEEATRLANEMTSRVKAGAGGWAKEVLDAAATAHNVPPPAA